MTKAQSDAAWDTISREEQQQLIDQVERIRANLPQRDVGDVGECKTNCRAMGSLMMQELASMYPGGNVPEKAARPVEDAVRACLDACGEMHPPKPY